MKASAGLLNINLVVTPRKVAGYTQRATFFARVFVKAKLESSDASWI
jgi:hypothetical protein